MIKLKLSEIKPNPNNPRLIKDDKFHKLVQSIKDFPEMLEKRPIVVNTDMVVLGGNMRLKACKEAGLKEIPVMIADWTEEQQREFIVKDNVGFGEWDWNMIANEWDAEELTEWGLDVWQATDVNLDDFFEENNEQEKEGMFKIVLEYTEEDYNKVIEAFSNVGDNKENVVFNLLGL